jgi:type IV secretion system protein VirB1
MPSLCAQKLSGLQFGELGRNCIAETDRPLVTAIVQTESAFSPYALSLNYPERLARKLGYPAGRVYLKNQPRTAEEARRWVEELETQGATLSVGLMQVNLESGYSLDQLLDPCLNLRAGWTLFLQDYARAVGRIGLGQTALLMAISAYNTGSLSRGYQNGYVQSVLRNASASR